MSPRPPVRRRPQGSGPGRAPGPDPARGRTFGVQPRHEDDRGSPADVRRAGAAPEEPCASAVRVRGARNEPVHQGRARASRRPGHCAHGVRRLRDRARTGHPADRPGPRRPTPPARRASRAAAPAERRQAGTALGDGLRTAPHDVLAGKQSEPAGQAERTAGAPDGAFVAGRRGERGAPEPDPGGSGRRYRGRPRAPGRPSAPAHQARAAPSPATRPTVRSRCRERPSARRASGRPPPRRSSPRTAPARPPTAASPPSSGKGPPG